MFGKKKKIKKKAVKKVSVRLSKSATKQSLKGTAKKKSQKKHGRFRVGTKYFDNPEDISLHYEEENRKIKEALRRHKINKTEGALSVLRVHLMKLLSQKKKLEKIAKDLDQHKVDIGKKIEAINFVKDKTQEDKNAIDSFVMKMKKLETAARKLSDSRELLLLKEAELITEMKKAAKFAQKDLDLTDAKIVNELCEFEASKESVLAEAKSLLSEEKHRLFADDALLDRMDEKVVKKLNVLNNQLTKINLAKIDTLKKRDMLKLSEKKTAHKLTQVRSKIRGLEKRYAQLLKK